MTAFLRTKCLGLFITTMAAARLLTLRGVTRDQRMAERSRESSQKKADRIRMITWRGDRWGWWMMDGDSWGWWMDGWR